MRGSVIVRFMGGVEGSGRGGKILEGGGGGRGCGEGVMS